MQWKEEAVQQPINKTLTLTMSSAVPKRLPVYNIDGDGKVIQADLVNLKVSLIHQLYKY